MVGSLVWALALSRNYEIMSDGERIDLAHIAPEVNMNLLITGVVFLDWRIH